MTLTTKYGRPAKASRTSIAPERVAIGSYIDSVVLIQHKRIDDDHFHELTKTFGPDRGVVGEDLVRDKDKVPGRGYTVHTLALHRPTMATVRNLNELLELGQSIKEVHVALDILTKSPSLAVAWKDFLEGHLITNPKAPHPTVVVNTTTYYNYALRAGEQYALYSDKTARLVEKMWCCHLEARVIGPRALEAAGVASPSALLHLNHHKFWSKRLDLRRPPSSARLARASNNSSNSRQDAALGNRANQARAAELLQSSLNERGYVVAQSLLANMRAAKGLYSSRPIRHFRKQRNDWLLPPSVNVHWEPESWAI